MGAMKTGLILAEDYVLSVYGDPDTAYPNTGMRWDALSEFAGGDEQAAYFVVGALDSMGVQTTEADVLREHYREDA